MATTDSDRWGPWSPYVEDDAPHATPLTLVDATHEIRSCHDPVFGAGTALYDASGNYRYRLTYRWGQGPAACFITLHAGMANESRTDPVVDGCLRFARAWGYAGAEIVSLFAYRTTDATALHRAADGVGPGNDAAILAAARTSAVTVATWGSERAWPRREDHVQGMLAAHGITVHTLGVSLAGHAAERAS